MYYIRNIAVLLSALLVGFFSANAQPNNWEEFEKDKALAVAELKSHPRPDTNRVNALINVCSTAVYLREREAVMQYRAEALDLSRRLGYVKGMASAYVSYGLYYKSRLEPAISQTYFDSALYIIGNQKEPRLIQIKAYALERKGTIFFEQDSYYQALDYFFESMKYSGFQPGSRKSNLYYNITQVYIRLNNLDKAEEYA